MPINKSISEVDASLLRACVDVDLGSISSVLPNIECINCMDRRGHTALHTVLLHSVGKERTARCARAVKLLCDHGADLRLVNLYGDSPLHLAAALGLADACSVLLDYGASIDLLNNHGSSPLSLAGSVSEPHMDVITLLLDRGADPNLLDRARNSVLCFAVEKGDYELASLLIDHKANPNLGTLHDRNALSMAVLDNNIPMCRLLLCSGAEIDLEGDDGRTPYEMALEGKNPHLIGLLEQHLIRTRITSYEECSALGL